MKTAQEIAQTLLNRRNAMNPVVMQGEMLLALEAEGLQEALQRRWLVPDTTNGYLLVTQDMAKVREMQEVVAEHCGTCAADLAKEKKEDKEAEEKDKWTKPWERPNESHEFALRHSTRPLDELLSPGTGHDSGGPLRSAPPAATPTAPPTSVKPPGMEKPGVGDDVVVVSKPAPGATESQTFTGKVSSAADGKVKINFSGIEREYPESEVKVVKKAVPTR